MALIAAEGTIDLDTGGGPGSACQVPWALRPWHAQRPKRLAMQTRSEAAFVSWLIALSPKSSN